MMETPNRLCCGMKTRRASTTRGWVKVLLFMVLVPILLGGIVLLVAGRPLAFEVIQRKTAARFPEVKWIPTDELATWQADTGQPQPILVDARTQPEFAISHLTGAHPIDPYRPSLRSLGTPPRQTAIVVYSSAGYRGARVTNWLAQQGYSTVVNLAGGIFKWANEGRPLLREEGRPTATVHPYDQRWGYLLEKQYRARAPDVPKQSAAP
jgi:rhodanese-related sulfurtransferase